MEPMLARSLVTARRVVVQGAGGRVRADACEKSSDSEKSCGPKAQEAGLEKFHMKRIWGMEVDPKQGSLASTFP